MGLFNKIKKVGLAVFIAGDIALSTLAGKAVYDYMGRPVDMNHRANTMRVEERKVGTHTEYVINKGDRIVAGAIAGYLCGCLTAFPLLIYQEHQEEKKNPRRTGRGYVEDSERTSGEYGSFPR